MRLHIRSGRYRARSAAPECRAGSTPPAMPSQEELLRRLEAAENRLKVLERQLEIQKEEAADGRGCRPASAGQLESLLPRNV